MQKAAMPSKNNLSGAPEGWRENAGWIPGPLSTKSSQSSQEQWSEDTPKVQSGKRFRKFCLKQRRQSRNEKPYSTRVIRKVRKGSRTSGHMPKNYERKAGKDDTNRKVLVDALRHLK